MGPRARGKKYAAESFRRITMSVYIVFFTLWIVFIDGREIRTKQACQGKAPNEALLAF
jgi:hypothetical protein